MHHWLLQIFWHLTLFSMSVSPPWIIFLAKVPCHALRSSIYLIFMNGKWHLCVFRRGACDCRVTLTVRATGGKGTEIFSSDKENIGVIYSMHRALFVIYNSGPTKCHFYIGHDLGQRVRIIQKRNRWADLNPPLRAVKLSSFRRKTGSPRDSLF